jgi:aminotransferase
LKRDINLVSLPNEKEYFPISNKHVAQRVQHFPESVIREMTRLAVKYDAINLAQGFPDFNPPESVLKAAQEALAEGYNQYAITWGAPTLREAIARKAKSYNHIEANPEDNVLVTCGATEAMVGACLAVIDPGDEVIIFEPYYENYGPDAVMSGATTKVVSLQPPDFKFSEEALKQEFSEKTKAVIINNPNNPSGKVFTRDELKLIADLCIEHDALAITDEIYEYILFDGREHISIASLPDMMDRTITISGMSKTYSMTGWRLGYAIGAKTLLDGMKRAHDFLTIGAPHPLQIAAVTALELPDSYYTWLRESYQEKRELFLRLLEEAGFRFYKPEAAYYVLADYTGLGFTDDFEFSKHLTREVKVACTPGSSFYSQGLGKNLVRFMFAKDEVPLIEAGRRLRGLTGH